MFGFFLLCVQVVSLLEWGAETSAALTEGLISNQAMAAKLVAKEIVALIIKATRVWCEVDHEDVESRGQLVALFNDDHTALGRLA